jgi:hypothetical protein
MYGPQLYDLELQSAARGLPPHCHQPLFRLLEFLRPFCDGLCLAGRFNIAEPYGLGVNDQNRPPSKCFICHEKRAYCIGAAPSRVRGVAPIYLNVTAERRR